MSESEVHRIIKYAVAKALVGEGYMVGVEVPRPGGGFFDVYGRKGNSEINIEIWKTNLPEWLIVRVKEEAIPRVLERGTGINRNVELTVSLPQSRYHLRSQKQQQQQQLSELDQSPQVEISKLTVFGAVYNKLSGPDRADVREDNLIIELVETGEFDDASMVLEYIMIAMEVGIIYRRKPGVYSKT